MKSAFNLSAVLAVALFSGSASASIDLNEYVLISAGFGIDGATNTSFPNPDSADLAKEIFNGLTVAANANGKKVAGISVMGETVGMESSSDGFALLAVVKASDMAAMGGGMGGMNNDVIFSGNIARAVYDALPVPAPSNPPVLGSSTRALGNLSCTMVVVPAAPVTCTVKNTAFIAFTLREAVDSSEGQFTEANAEELVKLSGI